MSLKTTFQKKLAPELQKELKIVNVMAVPKLEKITVNIGFGNFMTRKGEKKPDRFLEALEKMTGQKPVVRNAKKSISNFKLREGTPIGASATLRGQRMYDFLERLIFVTVPRIRDFRGFNRKTDGMGNFSIGIKEQTAFPEIGEVESKDLHGVQITFTTSAESDKEVYALFGKFGFPFKK